VKERILVINSEWPEETSPVQAATLVNFQILRELARRLGVETGYLKIFSNGNYTPMNDVQKEAKSKLESAGVLYLPPVELPIPPRPRPRFARLLIPKLVDFYPITVHRKVAYSAAQTFNPTSIIIQWCEKETHLYSEFPAKKFAYYGNSDAIVQRIWTQYISQFRDNIINRIIRNLQMQHLERFHLREMAKWDFIGDVSLNFVKYYQRKLGDKAFYLNNIWLDRYGEDWKSRRDELEAKDKLRIVGNIGHLSGSANVMGLEILARDILPELRKLLPEGSFEIDIYGRNRPLAHIERLLKQPEFKIRGFVDDLDTEMFGSQIFLCVNNASPYKTCHTRYLHAWSLGCCVVAHRDAALSMPEIKHGYNALLGENPREIAGLIVKAASDPQLRRELGENGYKTLEKEFRVDHVVDTMLEKLASIEH
jgi:glycosyltransferase involved in cell wall biosynthesis